MKKLITATASAALAASLLVACSDSSDTTPVTVTETPAPVTETVTDQADATAAATETVTENASAAPAQSEQNQPENVPSTISGYSTQAEMEMQEDQLTEADVEAVLKAAVDGQARVEWDRDGYFELEHNGIDVDITPEGEVLDASR